MSDPMADAEYTKRMRVTHRFVDVFEENQEPGCAIATQILFNDLVLLDDTDRRSDWLLGCIPSQGNYKVWIPAAALVPDAVSPSTVRVGFGGARMYHDTDFSTEAEFSLFPGTFLEASVFGSGYKVNTPIGERYIQGDVIRQEVTLPFDDVLRALVDLVKTNPSKYCWGGFTLDSVETDVTGVDCSGLTGLLHRIKTGEPVYRNAKDQYSVTNNQHPTFQEAPNGTFGYIRSGRQTFVDHVGVMLDHEGAGTFGLPVVGNFGIIHCSRMGSNAVGGSIQYSSMDAEYLDGRKFGDGYSGGVISETLSSLDVVKGDWC